MKEEQEEEEWRRGLRKRARKREEGKESRWREDGDEFGKGGGEEKREGKTEIGR